jgi:predicted nucleic acid-binding protein
VLHNGDIVQGLASPEGLFHADTRHLSLCTLILGGRRPLLLSSTLRADNATLTCDLTNPDLCEGERLCVSVITAAELRFGADKAGTPKLTELVEAFLERLSILDWTDGVTHHYARIRSALERGRRHEDVGSEILQQLNLLLSLPP